MAFSGRFSPSNPKKYYGDCTAIKYRSLWERKFMKFCDTNPDVLEWSSEEIIVRYYSPFDKKMHRYFPDFYVKLKQKDGKTVSKLIEIKPNKQTKQPIAPKKKTVGYLTEMKTWIINNMKWKAAKEYCDIKGWEFVILTEKDLFK